MLRFIILFGILLMSNAWAFSGRKAWSVSNMRQRVALLNEYRAFFAQHPEALKDWEKKVTRWSLISEAWADGEMDCIYAGWPSQRVGGLCSSPARMNPGYQAGSCSENELHCQPMLFGEGLCAPVATKSQRNLAFSNCNKAFEASGKTTEDVIRALKEAGKEAELLSLLDFADRICSTGAQKNKPMCRRLEAIVQRVRAGLPEVTAQVIVEGTTSQDERVRTDVVEAVTTSGDAAAVVTEVTRVPADCEEVQAVVNDAMVAEGQPFERVSPREGEFEFVTSRQGSDPVISEVFLKVKDDEELRPQGFEFRMTGPNDIAGAPIDPEQKVERNWNFVSVDKSKRDTYLWVTDDAGSGYLSQLMESVILIVPRKVQPAVTVVGDELHVTLTTGEKVVYDKNTRLVKSGVLSEGKVDLNPNRFNRKFAPITYSGTGISIRTDKRGEDPRLVTGNATVTQNGKTCQVPAQQLWDAEANFKYEDDAALVAFLNQKCGGEFSL